MATMKRTHKDMWGCNEKIAHMAMPGPMNWGQESLSPPPGRALTRLNCLPGSADVDRQDPQVREPGLPQVQVPEARWLSLYVYKNIGRSVRQGSSAQICPGRHGDAGRPNDTPKDMQLEAPDSWSTNFSCTFICQHLPLLIHKINAAVLN